MVLPPVVEATQLPAFEPVRVVVAEAWVRAVDVPCWWQMKASERLELENNLLLRCCRRGCRHPENLCSDQCIVGEI